MQINILGKKLEFSIKNAVVQSLPALYNDAAWLAYLQGKGHPITTETALKVAVVIRCADVVAKTMSSLGCVLYQVGTIGDEKAKKHPLYKILRMMPNPETTAYEFWHMYIFNLMLTIGAYAKIVRNNSGEITALWNIPTKNVSMHRNDTTGERFIRVWTEKGVEPEILYEKQFMFTPGLRFNDPNNPDDFIRIAADVLGLTMDLNSYAKDYFENGSNPGGFIEYPAAINEVQFAKFKTDWQQAYAGVTNQHKWAILEAGFKVNKMDSNPESAQALESRKFQIEEVCRLMGVPPHKAFVMEKVSYNSMEQSNIEYVQETIDPMDERLDQTIYKDLLLPFEREIYHAKFNVLKLLKGDTAARTTYFNTMRQNGVMNANEIREKEDMNKISPEEGGDTYFINGALISMKYAKDNKPKSLQTSGNNQ